MLDILRRIFKRKPRILEVRVLLNGPDDRIDLNRHLEIREFLKSNLALHQSSLDISDGSFVGVYQISKPDIAMLVKLTWGGHE